MLKTIKSTLSTVSSVAIIIVSLSVLALSIKVHEQLYLESVTGDLNALSENMANDLVPFLTSDAPDLFGITTTLLGLDTYNNVKYAIVFDNNNELVTTHVGKSTSNGNLREVFTDSKIATYPVGMAIQQDDLIASKIIGEQSLSLGRLVIVNDLRAPLSRSKTQLLSQVLPLLVIVVLLGILILRWQNRKLLAPFSHLAKLANKIKQTNDYTIDISVIGKQEVQDLTTEFSSMMKTINQKEVKNNEYNDLLKQQRRDMEYLANFDSLTDLPNRHFFISILGDALSSAKQSSLDPALMYIDLDAFKDVNDTYGHYIGDNLLVAVSQRIKQHLGHSDQLARLGGDEFLLMVGGRPSSQYLKTLASIIIDDLSTTYVIQEWEINISASIGVALASSADYSVSNFIGNADVAMYCSKVDGKNTYTLFNAEMMEGNQRKLMIAASLVNAVKHDEFTLFYQPKVDSTHKIVGFEGLIRWTSKELGLVPPDEFIHIAEKSGRIHLVTHWVIERACKDINTLRAKYGTDIVLSINLSSVDLKLSTLAEDIQGLFTIYDVPAHCMQFEVTESAYLENFEEANSFFERVEKIGCTIALDDFGTGYSSLSYLTQINIHTLKIDKQFVDHIGTSERDTLITKTIIEMAKQLNMQVCAEGVETLDQADFLINAGCQNLQGYYFGKPSALDDLV